MTLKKKEGSEKKKRDRKTFFRCTFSFFFFSYVRTHFFRQTFRMQKFVTKLVHKYEEVSFEILQAHKIDSMRNREERLTERVSCIRTMDRFLPP